MLFTYNSLSKAKWITKCLMVYMLTTENTDKCIHILLIVIETEEVK